jgi:hypothetical protein
MNGTNTRLLFGRGCRLSSLKEKGLTLHCGNSYNFVTLCISSYMDYLPHVDFDDNFWTNTSDESLQDLERDVLMVSTMMMTTCNTHNLFKLTKLKEGGQTTTNHNVWSTNILNRKRNMPTLFKVLTNFKVCIWWVCLCWVNPKYKVTWAK